jgi:CRP/FNR family cyclic AMP-dependent transcriptional regulator
MTTLLDLCRDLPVQHFAAGDALLTEGERSGRLYILIEGEVEVRKGDVEIPTITEPGSIFGELSALLGLPHTALVRALTPCRVHVIEQADAFLRSNPVVTYQLARLLAQRLNTITTYLADLKNQFQDAEDHLGMVDEVLHNLLHQQVEECAPGSVRDPDSAT